MSPRIEGGESQPESSEIMGLRRGSRVDKMPIILGRLLAHLDEHVRVYNYDQRQGRVFPRFHGGFTAISFSSQEVRSVFDRVCDTQEYQALRLASIGDLDEEVVTQIDSCPWDKANKGRVMVWYYENLARRCRKGSRQRQLAEERAQELLGGFQSLSRCDIIDLLEPVVDREWHLVVEQTGRPKP